MKNLNMKIRVIGLVVLVSIFAGSEIYAQRMQRIFNDQTTDDTRLYQNRRPGRMYDQNVQGRMYNRNFDGRGMGLLGLNLTEEQQLKFNELRTRNMKEMLPLNNQMQEKRARLRTLTTAEVVNQKEIDKLIDEMTADNAKQMKMRVKHQQEIRSLLTEEQRVIFDSSNRGFGNNRMGQNYTRSGNRAARPGFGFRTR